MKAIDRLAEICQTGDLDEAKKLVAKIPFNPALKEQNVLIQACKHGHMHIVRWLLEDKRFNKNRDDYRAFRVACLHGHLELAKMLKCPSGKQTLDAFTKTCKKGHFEVAKWLLLDKYVNEAMYGTITPEFYEELPDKENKTSKWIKAIVDIRTKYNNLCPYRLRDECLKNDDLNTFKFVCSCFADPNFGLYLNDSVGCINENPKILEWILKHKYATINEKYFKDAWNSISNRRSSFEVVLCFLKHVPETIHLNPKSVLSKEEWRSAALCFLNKYRELWNGSECLVNADMKKIELIFQLYPQLTSNYRIISFGLASAFRENNFELAQFLFSKYNGSQCYLGSYVFVRLLDITNSNYNSAFDFTLEHIKPYYLNIKNHFIDLCSKNRFECAEYIMSRMPHLKERFTEEVVSSILKSLDFDDLNVMKWACKTFSIHSRHFDDCFKSAKLNIKQWLLETKADFISEFNINNFFNSANLEIKQWLLETKREIITDSIINDCFMNTDLETKKWLLETKPEIITDSTINDCFMETDLDTKKLLLEIKPGIITDSTINDCFMETDLETKKWFLETRTDIITDSTIKSAFEDACLDGKTEQLFWFIEQRSNLFEDDFLDSVFTMLCSMCKDLQHEYKRYTTKKLTKTALWFQEYRYERYRVKIHWFNILFDDYILDSYEIIRDVEPIAVSTIEICSICYSNESNVMTKCKHQFCNSCIEKWLMCKNTCPICRGECYDFVPIIKG